MQKLQGGNLFMDNNTHNWLLPHTVIITCVLLAPFDSVILKHAMMYCTHDIIDNSKKDMILILHIVILRTSNNIAI